MYNIMYVLYHHTLCIYIIYTYCCIYIIYTYCICIHMCVCCVVGCCLLYLCFIFVFVFSIRSTNFCVRSCINHDENRPPSPLQHLMHLRLGIPTHQVVPRIGNLVKPTPRVPLPHSKIPTGSASCTNAPTMPAISSVVKMRTIPLLDSRISRYGNHWDHVTAPLS